MYGSQTARRAQFSATQKAARRSAQARSRQMAMRSRIPRALKSDSFVRIKARAGQITITQSLAAIVKGALSFSLVDIPDSASYAAVFDQYRLSKIQCLIQASTLNTPQTVANSPSGLLCTVIDYDDTTALASYAAALNFETSMVHNTVCNDIRNFTPHVTGFVTSGPTNTYSGNTNHKKQWLDSAVTNSPHFGFKYIVPQGTGTGVFFWTLTFTYIVDFKNSR